MLVFVGERLRYAGGGERCDWNAKLVSTTAPSSSRGYREYCQGSNRAIRNRRVTITSAPTGEESMGTMSMENVKGLYQTQSASFASFP
ncbi:hypothetical protein [Rhodopirellula halodulae]|uniref:hypothetical protein n=1 Tax=Rhodopirellula halodulae TaxID=2894198 RepID=UPI001E57CF21|nr:hypothetical protein [Rhodopirellula sp. JC740]